MFLNGSPAAFDSSGPRIVVSDSTGTLWLRQPNFFHAMTWFSLPSPPCPIDGEITAAVVGANDYVAGRCMSLTTAPSTQLAQLEYFGSWAWNGTFSHSNAALSRPSLGFSGTTPKTALETSAGVQIESDFNGATWGTTVLGTLAP
jgi:hypothetical protein